VKDSRGSTTRSGVKVIRRRRKCLDCEARYSTLEIAVESIKEELADIEALGGIDAIDAQLNAIQGQIQRLQDTLTAAKRLRSAASLQKTGT
jgi:hypothetical protein